MHLKYCKSTKLKFNIIYIKKKIKTSEPRIYNGKRQSATNSVGKTGQPQAKNELGSLSYTYIKIKEIKDINVIHV